MSILVYFFSFLATIFLPLKIKEISSFIDLVSLFQVLAPLAIILFAKHKMAVFKFYKNSSIAKDGLIVSLLIGVLETLLGLVVLGSNINTKDMLEILPPALSVIVLPLVYSVVIGIFAFFPFINNGKKN